MRLTILLFALAAAAAPQAVLGQVGFQDLNALDRQIAEATGGRAEPLDRRLKLQACAEMISISADGPMPSVRCGAYGWRIALRVNGGAMYNNAPIAIRRGDEVTVTIEGNGFQLTGSGIAMDDGREGGTVRVKTSTTGTPVSVRVTGPGTASLRG
ncbi:MAG TPA: flagella basal body P-ring formation protein FlgA [Sphingomonas sp.]|jgi:flagella basal body P-ring formation protein FlgA|nr:flagella basal body P-ring formation protein FlgA [Sphingomonas sp.]